MVRRLVTSGDGVEVVVGKAGTGKTTALAAATQAWHAAGLPVVSTAVAARAALGLGQATGTPALTITRLLAAADQPVPTGDGRTRPAGLARGSVVVVDEAGMLGTRALARLLTHTQTAAGKLVLVGDHRQLPEIDAGGTFAALTHLLAASELRTNRRQQQPWERDALDHVRDGDLDTALAAYDQAGRLTRTTGGEQARDSLSTAWAKAALPATTANAPQLAALTVASADPDVVMLALRRSDVDDLNHRARQLLKQAGLLTGPELSLPGPGGTREFAAGDLVVLRRNDYRHGLVNGSRGTIQSVDPRRCELHVDLDGRTVRIPASYLAAGHVDHGYALTVHQAQGVTVDQALLLGSDALYREAGYVALSRGRQHNSIHLPDPATAPQDRDDSLETCHSRPAAGDGQTALEALTTALQRRREQQTASSLHR